ncbi:MAG: ATP-binding protein [Spirosomataceae bacterium]
MLSVDIYNQKNTLKLTIFVVAGLMVLVSMYYTDQLVKQLELREERQVQLYAQGLRAATTSYDENVDFIMNYIVKDTTNTTIPVVYINETGFLSSINIKFPPNATRAEQQAINEQNLEDMKDEHPPIELDLGEGKKGYIYYSNSFLLKQLRYFPLIQLFVVLLFGGMAYIAFSSARRAEQNRVWVGLAKETAHQLGTPLSSLTAWVEFFKADPEHYDPHITVELEKDVQRLGMITTRFSNIGSVPTLKDESIYEIVHGIASYLQKRISTKVKISVSTKLPTDQTIPINRYLFEWVIENLCKNAADAIGGMAGEIKIEINRLNYRQIAIDVTDTGKGIPKSNFKKVFNAGFSTKTRGWGLGLTLAKRIVENYHDGKLMVHHSEIGKGTTFRVIMPG